MIKIIIELLLLLEIVLWFAFALIKIKELKFFFIIILYVLYSHDFIVISVRSVFSANVFNIMANDEEDD